jgi:predicted amidophosphoribosyltransferase
MIKCPECGEKFEEDPDLIVGDVTYCPECYAELKIIATDPIRVKVCKDHSEGNDYLDDYEEEDDDMFYKHDEGDDYDEDDYYEN